MFCNPLNRAVFPFYPLKLTEIARKTGRIQFSTLARVMVKNLIRLDQKQFYRRVSRRGVCAIG